MNRLAFCVLLSGCFNPVVEGRSDGGCVESSVVGRDEFGADFYTGQFFRTDAGVVGRFLTVVDPATGASSVAVNDIQFVIFSFLPTWFHPDGYRTMAQMAHGEGQSFWLLDVDASLKSTRSTYLTTTEIDSMFWVAPTAPTGRRLDACVFGYRSSLDARLMTLDDRSLIQRSMPFGVRECADALETDAGTLFLVQQHDGGQGLVRVSPTSIDWLAKLPTGLCRLAPRSDAGLSLWCAKGRRLWQADAFDASVLWETTADSDFRSLSVFVGLEGTVVAGNYQDSGDLPVQYSILDVTGRRRTMQGWFDQPLFARLDDQRILLGASIVRDSGIRDVELKVICW